MKEKLIPLLVALLMLSSVFVGLVNQKENVVIKAEASGGSQDRCPLTLRSDIINGLVDWGSRDDPWVKSPVPYFWI